jgi:ergothioneine biosynthesis protein EgtB
LKTEDYVVQPSPDVSPPKWHLAHTTWFWEEFILSKYISGYKRFHPQFSFLFNSYYNTIGDRVLRPDRGNMSRPAVEEIFAYRHYVDEHMSVLLKDHPREVIHLIDIGLNHEQQHQELLFTDIKYILGHNPLFPSYHEEFSETPELNCDNTFRQIQGGSFKIGFPGDGFSFDNEHGCHLVELEDFSIRNSLVNNGEYLEFINDNGYRRPEFWLSDGWTWVNENKIQTPLYWNVIEGNLQRYSLAGLEDLKADEPVTHISFYEASAFAQWKGMRLPTEFEWEASADKFLWGQRWEHTNSAYLPYPRYKKPDGGIGEYNGKFMINQMVLRVASVVTPRGHSRNTYRNFFHPSSRWQFNGIRLCL